MIDLGFRLGRADFVLSQRQPNDNRCLEDCVEKDSKARAQQESAEGKMIQYLLCASSCAKCSMHYLISYHNFARYLIFNRYYYGYIHSTDVETGTENLSNLPNLDRW